MAVLPLTYIPDNVLRKKTRKVTKLTSEMFSLIEDMIETMHVEHGANICKSWPGPRRPPARLLGCFQNASGKTTNLN